MGLTDPQPGLDEIEGCFVAVLDGRLSRDAADRWARRWFLDDGLEWGEVELWALELLFGIDLRQGAGGEYLHPDEQVREWLRELRGLGARRKRR